MRVPISIDRFQQIHCRIPLGDFLDLLVVELDLLPISATIFSNGPITACAASLSRLSQGLPPPETAAGQLRVGAGETAGERLPFWVFFTGMPSISGLLFAPDRVRLLGA
jgi:hypothetical protein